MPRWAGVACALALPAMAAASAPEGWQLQPSPVGDDLHAAVFLDADTGWILAHRSGAVLRTDDGGASWAVLAELEDGFREWIAFSGPRQGWVCGDGSIAYTEDGGVSWSPAALEAGSEPTSFGSIFFTDAQNGVALGFEREERTARVVISGDGGASWQTRDDAAPDGAGFTDALAIDRASGAILAGGFGAVYRSDDGGGSWQIARLAGDTAVRGLDARGLRGWAVGEDGLLARSDDGGRTWRILPKITRAHLRGILFADRTTGWIVGDLGPGMGLLYETRDGGERWRRLDTELPSLHRIVRGGDRLWIVGAGGTILSRQAPSPPP